jgi:hypothetical protein
MNSDEQIIPKHFFPSLREALAEQGIELTDEQLRMHLIDFCGPFKLVEMNVSLDARQHEEDMRWFNYALTWIKKNVQKHE